MDAIEPLVHLVRVDMDAVRAYTQAIHAIQDDGLKEVLQDFREDHERHIRDLSAAIRDLGGDPPQQPHISAFALAGFTRIASGMGVSTALMAMQSNEVVTNQAYEIALNSGLPRQVLDLVHRNHRDEQRHLETIRTWLEDSSPAGRILSTSATAQGVGTSVWMNVIKANPLAAAVAASGAAMLLGNAMLGRRRREPWQQD
ncbi:DUF2383 domain-containing protein [Telmatospirillum sp. J64-1]|uniref:DUF2383 domain-containing protein n=1 Tax=Telmatospirillum sp. J64-1 TaxID=2502183 RepID=UPI00115CC55B|nr:ferritin-like domain-containing protein [Telmatospirillum sp. J64-1]